MAVHLDSILFNIDPSIGQGAINLREDAFHSVTLPEWREGSGTAEKAPAAYITSQKRPGGLLLQASLWKDPVPETVWLRTEDISPDKRNLLGEIPEFRVEFQDRQHRYLTIAVPLPRFSPAEPRVERHDDAWRWHYRTSRGDRGIAAVTRQRIYSLLDTPHSPWDASSGNSCLWPWRQVLDLACVWAHGATNTREAADRIGRSILQLGECKDGRRQFRYDIRDTTSTLADTTFDCIEFLRMAQGRPFAIHKGCCSDFASMLVTLANAVGCNLTNLTLRMGDNTMFFTNPVKAVGQTDFQRPFRFRFHEVAITGDPGPEARVWDSCFFVGDANLVRISKRPHEALNMRFGGPGDGGYLDRLVQPSFRPEIVPEVETPNRSVMPLIEPAEIRSGISGIAPTPPPGPATEKIFIADLFLAGIHFNGWTLRRISFPKLANQDTEIDSYWELKERPGILLRLRIEIEDTIREAQDRVIRRREHSSAARSLQEPSSINGNHAPEVVILTAIGNLSITAQNVGFEDTDLLELNGELEKLFAKKQKPQVDLGNKQLSPAFRTDVPIRFQTTDLSVWFKLFTSTGDLFAQGRDIFYTPGDGSEHAIEVFEMAGMRAARRYVYKFQLPEARSNIQQ